MEYQEVAKGTICIPQIPPCSHGVQVALSPLADELSLLSWRLVLRRSPKYPDGSSKCAIQWHRCCVPEQEGAPFGDGDL